MKRAFSITLVLLAVGLLGACEKGVKLKELQPPFGNIAGNDDVVLVGNGFKPGMTVQFGKRQVKTIVVESSTRIRVKTPGGPEGKVDVVLTDETGASYVLKDGFSYRKGGESGTSPSLWPKGKKKKE